MTGDAFLSALFSSSQVRCSARATTKAGAATETRTVVLRGAVPSDLSDQAFVEAAGAGGVDLAVRLAAGGRAKGVSGKDVHGAAAQSATAAVLGYKPAQGDPVPDALKRRGRSTPSENGTPETAKG